MTDEISYRPTKGWKGVRVLVLSPTPTFPADYGNRRRIYHVCRRLKDLGAEIHFMHYPTEEEWGRSVPLEYQRRMACQWDAYYVAPVTRTLYTPPAGADHQIDEWWDPGIGQMLDWLFRVQSFDVFLVNYAWLSKAFESTPPGVFKILDTHDKFSDRRHLLEGNGLAADFFYTTPDQERIGLNRADLVWAIKAQEEAALRQLCDRPVMAVLHAEPLATRWPKARSDVIRFGMAGSDNNVNRINFTRFLAVAHAYLRKTLLPCEIVIGGSCCELLRDGNYPFVRQLGRLKSMDEFYEEVDVVLGPMEFSTGLKVRIGEAMSLGKAVISHAHCFEGYVPSHEFHTLPAFEMIMRACREIVRTPQLIDDLEAASVESITRAHRSVDIALHTTLPKGKTIPDGFVILLQLSELQEGSIILDHICEVAVFVGHQCKILFFLDGQDQKVEQRSLVRLQKLGDIVVSPQLADSLAGKLGGLAALGVASFGDLLNHGQLAFWFTFAPKIPARLKPLLAPAFMPLSILAFSTPAASLQQFVANAKFAFSTVFVMDVTPSRLLASAVGRNVRTSVVPFLWRGYLSETLNVLRESPRETVMILVAEPSGTLFDLACDIARRSTNRVIEIAYDDVSTSRPAPPASVQNGTAPITRIGIKALSHHLWRTRVLPAIVIQIGEHAAFAAFHEWFDRANVPILTLFSPDAPRPITSGRRPERVSGVMESAMVLADVLADESRFTALGAAAAVRYATPDDSGWTIVWERVGEIADRAFERAAVTDPQLASDLVNDPGRAVKAEIILNLQYAGDRRYVKHGWLGIRGSKEYISAFGIRPLEMIASADIEYRAIGPNGQETPWVSDAQLCGTNGQEIPLTGFAIRLAPRLRSRFDVIYEGSFMEGGSTEAKKNGELCLPRMTDDPLEAIHIRILERPGVALAS